MQNHEENVHLLLSLIVLLHIVMLCIHDNLHCVFRIDYLEQMNQYIK